MRMYGTAVEHVAYCLLSLVTILMMTVMERSMRAQQDVVLVRDVMRDCV